MSSNSDPYATHQAFLKHYIQNTTGDVIEFGTGDGSTGFILDLLKDTGRHLVSLDDNYVWYDRMRSKYPPSEFHRYIFVQDWEKEIEKLDKSAYSIVFVDQSPWEARTLTMNAFLHTADYIIIHDVDYFPKNNMFGSVLSEFKFDFSDKFKKWSVYHPQKPWPSPTGPPTLVGTNKDHLEIYEIRL